MSLWSRRKPSLVQTCSLYAPIHPPILSQQSFIGIVTRGILSRKQLPRWAVEFLAPPAASFSRREGHFCSRNANSNIFDLLQDWRLHRTAMQHGSELRMIIEGFGRQTRLYERYCRADTHPEHPKMRPQYHFTEIILHYAREAPYMDNWRGTGRERML